MRKESAPDEIAEEHGDGINAGKRHGDTSAPASAQDSRLGGSAIAVGQTHLNMDHSHASSRRR